MALTVIYFFAGEKILIEDDNKCYNEKFVIIRCSVGKIEIFSQKEMVNPEYTIAISTISQVLC